MTDTICPRSEALDPLVRIEAKVDALHEAVAIIKATCPACRALIEKHEKSLYGNGGNGLLARIAATERGRVDTLSVASLGKMMKWAGTLAGAVSAAVAVLVTALAKLVLK